MSLSSAHVSLLEQQSLIYPRCTRHFHCRPRAVTPSRLGPCKRRLHTAAAAVDASQCCTQLVVVASTPEQYFPAADLHASCFGHSRSPNQALFERFDRIWALQINDDLARRGAGRCTLLIALDPSKAPTELLSSAQQPAANGSSSGDSSTNGTSGSSNHSSQPQSPQLEVFQFPRLGYWLSRSVDEAVWMQLGTSYYELGIVGVAQVDTFGDIIPPRTLSASRDGAVGWVKRDGYAYISNVAVAPSCRRSGVAVRLMEEAESLAAIWGCSKAGLHCNPTNTAAMQLYKRLRYKKAALEAPWMPYLQGRAPDRCYLMVKRLSPSRAKKHQNLQQQQQQQQEVKQVQPEQRLTVARSA